MAGAIKQMVAGLLFILILKSLVFLGLLKPDEINNPLSIQLDIKGLDFLKSNDNLDIFKIVDGKAEIDGSLFDNFDLVEINGKVYVVDLGITKVNLKEYNLIQRVKRNFHLLNSESKFAWAYYIRLAIFVIVFLFFFLPEFGFLGGLFSFLIGFCLLTATAFLLVGLLGWTGWIGFSIFLFIIIFDMVIGAINEME